MMTKEKVAGVNVVPQLDVEGRPAVISQGNKLNEPTKQETSGGRRPRTDHPLRRQGMALWNITERQAIDAGHATDSGVDSTKSPADGEPMAIDSKLRGCDLVQLKVVDVFTPGQVKERCVDHSEQDAKARPV